MSFRVESLIVKVLPSFGINLISGSTMDEKARVYSLSPLKPDRTTKRAALPIIRPITASFDM